MAKTIKKHWEGALIVGFGLFLVVVAIAGMSGMIALPNTVSAATDTEEITVLATVAEAIDITVTSSVMNFGTLSDGSVNATSGSFTVKTNAANGYTVSIKGLGDGSLGGLLGTTSARLVTSTATTLSSGSEGYGGQGTSTDSDVNINAAYDYVGTDQVGELATTSATFCTSSSATVGDQSTLWLKATISATTTADTYYDTITLTAVGSF